GSPAQLEARRRRAVALLDKGLGVRAVARQIGCSPTSVSRWQAEVQAGGLEALRPKPPPGRPPGLTARQRQRLLRLLLKGATARGYPTDLWTLPRVAAVIAQTFGVRYHPAHVWRILRGEGWSCQKPERRARERDEAAIQRWRQDRWPHIKKRPARR
ncbi:MAG: IS630 family transposase, partial [Candidatus Methylomirabilales bacterium]